MKTNQQKAEILAKRLIEDNFIDKSETYETIDKIVNWLENKLTNHSIPEGLAKEICPNLTHNALTAINKFNNSNVWYRQLIEIIRSWRNENLKEKQMNNIKKAEVLFNRLEIAEHNRKIFIEKIVNWLEYKSTNIYIPEELAKELFPGLVNATSPESKTLYLKVIEIIRSWRNENLKEKHNMSKPMSKEEDHRIYGIPSSEVKDTRYGSYNIPGLGPDSPTVIGESGGKRSDLQYRFDALPPLAIADVARVLAHGANKYGKNNWCKIPANEHLNHCLAHLTGYLAGDTQENGKVEEHLVHSACRILFALDTILREKQDNSRDGVKGCIQKVITPGCYIAEPIINYPFGKNAGVSGYRRKPSYDHDIASAGEDKTVATTMHKEEDKIVVDKVQVKKFKWDDWALVTGFPTKTECQISGSGNWSDKEECFVYDLICSPRENEASYRLHQVREDKLEPITKEHPYLVIATGGVHSMFSNKASAYQIASNCKHLTGLFPLPYVVDIREEERYKGLK